MTDRKRLIRRAFDSLGAGDLEPFRALFAPDAEWVGIPRGEERAVCPDRSEIVGLLERHHRNGRRFAVGEMLEERDRVAAEVTVTNPAWSGPVRTFKVFTFRPGEEVVVRLNDCADESYARQVLAA